MKHSVQEVATGKIFTSSHSIDITHVEGKAIAIFTNQRKIIIL
ncbi:hypothetical protein [Okeania sp. SIO3B5]|nr:hypothetical protein [Okeania sp. SIO3B5]